MDGQDPARRAWRTDDEWNRLRARMDLPFAEPARRPVLARRVTWLVAAAAAIVVVAGGAIALRHRAPVTPAAAPVTIATSPGQRTSATLPDGSRIVAGPDTRISFVASGSSREVQLEGMASFVVVHDAARPFVVRAGNAIATDVGTEFVVRAYPGDTAAEVTVTSGAVALGAASQPAAKPVWLAPGDVGLVRPGAAPQRSDRGSAPRVAWLDGQLAFDDADVASALRDVSRWFGLDIRASAGAFAGRRVTAVYPDPTLDGVLDALALTLDARIVKTSGAATLYPRQP
jgi:transmembrane sensor